MRKGRSWNSNLPGWSGIWRFGGKDQSIGPRTGNQASSKSSPHLQGAGGSSRKCPWLVIFNSNSPWGWHGEEVHAGATSHCLRLPITGNTWSSRQQMGDKLSIIFRTWRKVTLPGSPPSVKSDHWHYMVQKDPDQTYSTFILSDIGFKRHLAGCWENVEVIYRGHLG